ncbi:MAG TPA: SGNH/GDSL hydrolase family protein [Labilithrix sp.]|nr:SGNH/GDSL hydrolase family protein [Labilithrix sp.]
MLRPVLAVAIATACTSFLGGCSRRDPAESAPPVPKESTSATTRAASIELPTVGTTEVDTPAEPNRPRSLAGKKVLHVGDSMVGGRFGLTRALEAKLEGAGAKIVRFTKVSETISSFDKAPTLRDLLRAHDPDIVVITLGANDATVPHPEAYAHSIENIVKRVADRECWWIGPPSRANAGSASTLEAVLREHAGNCRFFDSSGLELERASDGIHPNDRGAGKWADAFWQVFEPAELH